MLVRTFHIGCSGYYYSYWKNRFYPKEIPAKHWLQYYSSIFNTVELNGTFYKTPLVSTLKKYAAQTPEHFRFSAKMSKYVSHILRLKNSRQNIVEFIDLLQEGLGTKLSCILFQMPPSFHYNTENLAHIIDNIPHHGSNIIELRHISWWNPEVKKLLEKAAIGFCNVDFPGLNSRIIQTTDNFYFRFHGNPELFKSSYSVKQLIDFYTSLPAAKQYYIYFNNTYYEAGYQNAMELKRLVGENID